MEALAGMKELKAFLLIGLVLVSPAYAQSIHAAKGTSHPSTLKQAKNPNSQLGGEPLKCDQYKLAAPHWYVYCRGVEVELVQGAARREGRPLPSRRIVDLPASGTASADGIGLACIGGSAMRRLKNGWEQVRDSSNNWLRCRVK